MTARFRLARKGLSQPPLFGGECFVCGGNNEHAAWCPQFLRGEADDAGEQMQIDSNEKEAD